MKETATPSPTPPALVQRSTRDNSHEEPTITPTQGVSTLNATKVHQEYDASGRLLSTKRSTLFLRMPDRYVLTIKNEEGELISRTYGCGLNNVVVVAGKAPEYFQSSVPEIFSLTVHFFDLPSTPKSVFVLVSSQSSSSQNSSVYSMGGLVLLTLVHSIPDNLLLSESTKNIDLVGGHQGHTLLTTYSDYQPFIMGTSIATKVISTIGSNAEKWVDTFSKIEVNANECIKHDDPDDKDLEQQFPGGNR